MPVPKPQPYYDPVTRTAGRMAHPHMSEVVRQAFRELLTPKPLNKGDGDYEIGVEANKRNIKESLEAFLGQPL